MPLIRIARETDVPAILAIYAPYVLTSTATFEYEVPTQEEFLTRFETVTKQYPWLVWEEEGRVCGYAYASPAYTRAAYAWTAEPSVYLAPEARGRGIAAALYGALEGILKYQGYQVLYALITEENSASFRFHEKMGYTKKVLFPDCGFKFGRWLGLTWWEKRLKPVEIPISTPTDWLSIRKNYQNHKDILDILSLSE